MQTRLPFFTLLLLISFASVNAVLFTPALPNITQYFMITEDKAQLTITWFLVGYALGQLLYGPIANRFGRKPALYTGIILQIISSLLCVFAGFIHYYGLLVIARFLLALGSGVGLKMTFTLVSECYEPKIASQKISYLMLAFAITPGLGVALGGFLNEYWNWMSCFYAGALYGFILLLFVTRLPETQTILDLNALNPNHLIKGYSDQFKNSRLVMSGLIMGCASSFIYIFAAITPFIAINIFGMNSDAYGLANCLPPIGLILGSLTNAKLTQKYKLNSIIKAGIGITTIGVLLMLLMMYLNTSIIISVFIPIIIIYFGLCFVIANGSVIAMDGVTDKAHGAAVMSFINVGLTTLAVLSIALFPVKTMLLPAAYFALCIIMFCIAKRLSKR